MTSATLFSPLGSEYSDSSPSCLAILALVPLKARFLGLQLGFVLFPHHGLILRSLSAVSTVTGALSQPTLSPSVAPVFNFCLCLPTEIFLLSNNNNSITVGTNTEPLHYPEFHSKFLNFSLAYRLVNFMAYIIWQFPRLHLTHILLELPLIFSTSSSSKICLLLHVTSMCTCVCIHLYT